MKKLDLPDVIDFMHLELLAENDKLHETSYPHLCNEIEQIKLAYSHYSSCQGNPWYIVEPSISIELENSLKSHYNSPPTSLDYLDHLREYSPDICPMCGGFKPSTLDHILPKSQYKAWAIYSRNLVPACDCNSKRGTALYGDHKTLERVLHPYFDDCMQERQLTCCVNTDELSIKITYVNPEHPCFSAIKFHVDNIVLKSGINGWLRSKINSLDVRPSNFIQTLPRKKEVTNKDVIDCLVDALERTDEQYGTPNNWTSILLSGLLDSNDAPAWVRQRHNESLPTEDNP